MTTPALIPAGKPPDRPVSSDNLSVAPSVLAGLLESFPDGVLAVDDRWRLVYANSAGAALLQRPAAELVGRDLWAAVPELADTTLHGFLLHARGAAEPVSWTGFYPPAGRWLTATAVDAEGLLQVTLRVATASGTGVDGDEETGGDGATGSASSPRSASR